jgi:4-amino-4-deoxy-L-arabinose transferase-like glycosyltransferase
MVMTADHPPRPNDGEREPVREPAGTSGDRVGQLRGAGVQVDARRLKQVAIAIVLVTLAALAIGFTIVGVHKNQQIDQLHTQGVPVTITVTGCLGLLGGSGSNAAGYSCHGTYTLHGHTYNESLPGSAFHRPGTTIDAVAVPGDPALVSPVAIADAQHSSASVYIFPAVLGGVLVVLLFVLIVRARRRHAGAPAADGGA